MNVYGKDLLTLYHYPIKTKLAKLHGRYLAR